MTPSVTLRKNVIANYLGQGWTALINLAFVPVYIRYLGIEAYGLIGLFAMLQMWVTLLDMGMTPTLNREVARHSVAGGSAESIRDLVHTFEIICVGLALAVTLAFALASHRLAHDWLNAKNLSEGAVAGALSIMGLVAGMRFVEGLYRGAILGLQKHVWLNVVGSTVATIRAVGAVLVLAWIEPSIRAFFYWQALVSAVAMIVFYFGVHWHLPRAQRRAVFSTQAFSRTWKFAGGVFVTTFLALMITQVDKVILSRLLSLEAFGTYTFAAAVAGVLFQLIGPISQSYYPQLTELVAKGDSQTLSRTYHQGAQLMTIMVAPAGMLLVAFGEPLLRIWTGNELLSNQAAIIVAVLSIGTILNGWMHLPYMLQLASGWSTLAVWTNLVAAIVIVPAIFWITPRFGSIGAAWVWVAVNVGYVLFEIHFMHVKLLPADKMKWYARDLAAPTLFATATISVSYFLCPVSLGRFGEIAWIGGTGCLAYVAAILGSSEYRHFIPMLYRHHVPAFARRNGLV